MSRAGQARLGLVMAMIAAVTVTIAAAGWSSAVERGGPPQELLRIHDDFVLAFIDSEGFGQHRLPAMAEVMHRKVKSTQGVHLYVMDLQMIGVAKHDPPRVFSNEMSIYHRPNTRTPPSPPTSRPIEPWERQALHDLDAGQRLIIEKKETGLRVVGPIRAGVECLGCHKNKRAGDMLGAFVYMLGTVPEQTPTK